MVKGLYDRVKRLIVGAGLCAAVAMPLLAPKPAQAWWGPGWGWRGGVVVGVPPVVVAPPVYAPAPYPYPYVAAGLPYWHWVPRHWNAAGILVEGHWEHR